MVDISVKEIDNIFFGRTFEVIEETLTYDFQMNYLKRVKIPSINDKLCIVGGWRAILMKMGRTLHGSMEHQSISTY